MIPDTSQFEISPLKFVALVNTLFISVTFDTSQAEISWLNDKWIYDIFHPYVHHANQQAGWNWKWDFSESFQFTVYHGRKQNGGFYGWHADGNNDIHSVKRRSLPGIYDENHANSNMFTPIKGLIGKVRKMSITLMLSDPNDYEGGNLKFDFGEHEKDRYKEVSGNQVQQGSMIVFLHQQI